MKKFAKLAGIIAVAAVIGLLAGCKEMGGTLVVKNSTDNEVTVTVIGLSKPKIDAIPTKASKTYSFDVDTDVTVTAVGLGITDAAAKDLQKKVTVEKGNTVTLTVSKTGIK